MNTWTREKNIWGEHLGFYYWTERYGAKLKT